MYFYQRIKDLREDKDLKQSEIAKLLQITQQQYSLYEKGNREIPLHLAIVLAKYYNVSIDYIAGLTNDKRGIGHSKEKRNIKINQSHSNKPVVNIKE